MFPEYVSFVLQTKHNLDFKKVAVELQAHLSQRLRDQYPKQSRLFHVRAHFDFDMIVIDVSCERRELVAYAQSKKSWPFFHTVILDAVYFLKTFDKRPLVVSYSDSRAIAR